MYLYNFVRQYNQLGICIQDLHCYSDTLHLYHTVDHKPTSQLLQRKHQHTSVGEKLKQWQDKKKAVKINCDRCSVIFLVWKNATQRRLNTFQARMSTNKRSIFTLASLEHFRISNDANELIYSMSILLVGGTVDSWLVRSILDRAVRVQDLTGDIALCSWTRQFTLTVPLSTQVYKWVRRI